MRRISLIIALIAAILIGGFLAAPWFILYAAKVRAVKQYTREPFTERTLNRVPESPPQHIAARLDYPDTVWMNGTDGVCRLGFPSDRFRRDDDPKRANAVIHHQRYRALIFPGRSAPEFAPVMQPFGFTNLYDFISDAFRATVRDISPQPNMEALLRHTVLLDAKLMLAPVGFEESCREFFRDNVKGFIIGDPVRSKHVFLWVFFEDQQQFVDLGVIPEAPISMSDLEALISVMKVSSKRPKSEKDLDAQERPKELSE
jgi:hypothetical protein